MTDEVDAILNDYFDYPEVTLSASGTPLENIKQITYNVPNFNTKVNLLKHLLESNEDMSRVLVLLITRRFQICFTSVSKRILMVNLVSLNHKIIV
jgi:ATP-dependent RNA helicase RhlE